MPVHYEIDRIRRVIRTKCVQNVTLPEVIHHFHELEQNPDCPDQLDVVLDWSEMTSLPSSDQLRAVSREIGRIRDHVRFGRCAIVVGSEAVYGTAMVFEVFAARGFRATKIFRRVGDAEAWLAAPESRG